jgi:EF hand
MKTQLLAVLTALALAPAALAQDRSMTGDHLAAIDGDADGAVQESEFRAFMERVFTELDANADGFVDWTEAQVTMIREHFDGADANGDGGLSSQEFRDRAQRDFQAADRDGDGQLD